MDHDRLAVCCSYKVSEVKRILAPWYHSASDCVFVPYEDIPTARRRLLGKDARSGRTPRTPATNRNGRILAVAHLDTAMSEYWVRDAGGKFFSPALDDRIGLYTFFFEFGGVECDILLTDNEEIGRSTAQWFKAGREYNWMIEFDRRGSDVVMYQYDTQANRRRLLEIGADAGLGSYSDIAYLDSLGVAGFNWGTGYHLEHTSRCHVVVSEYRRMLELFKVFYGRYGDERIEHQEVVEYSRRGVESQWSYDMFECELCGWPTDDSELRWSGELQCWVCWDKDWGRQGRR